MSKKKKRIKKNSIKARFLLAFLLFGLILVVFSVAIQNDLTLDTLESQIITEEEHCLYALEHKLGDSDWHIVDGTLYRGDVRIGDGSPSHANQLPFVELKDETDTDVNCFIYGSFASNENKKLLERMGMGTNGYIRVSGTPLGFKDENLVGTVLNGRIAAILEESGEYTGVSQVEGVRYYCTYRIIRNSQGIRIGAIAAGCNIEEVEKESRKLALNASISSCILIIYSFFALYILISRWIRYLRRAEDYLVDIGKGEFPEKPLIISTGDELGQMADVINVMKKSLQDKQKLSAEYEAAKIIQTQLLPDKDAISSLPSCISIAAYMDTAKTVGGDLYDFFMIDETHFGIVIADVSEKGVPAALFMATSKMCIKVNMQLGIDPDQVLFRVNNMLNENNKSGMFVTAWIGILDITNGRLKYASAGHPSPLVHRVNSDHYEEMITTNNLVLGGFLGFRFRQNETVIHKGDRLFLYTDGLTEAGDPDYGFYGKGRLIQYLDSHVENTLEEIGSGLKKDVIAFVNNRKSFDDVTMLLFEYNGGGNHGC